MAAALALPQGNTLTNFPRGSISHSPINRPTDLPLKRLSVQTQLCFHLLMTSQPLVSGNLSLTTKRLLRPVPLRTSVGGLLPGKNFKIHREKNLGIRHSTLNLKVEEKKTKTQDQRRAQQQHPKGHAFHISGRFRSTHQKIRCLRYL